MKVTKHTRAGRDGKLIVCPRCNASQRTFHFCWSAASCDSCKAMVNKYEWSIAASSGKGENMKRIDLPSENDDRETFLDKFSRLYWKETASDIAFIAPLLPDLFTKAGVNYAEVAALFQESLKQEACSPEQEKAWMMVTGAVSKLVTVTGTMMLFENNEKERLLYVLRVSDYVTNGFEAGEAWSEHEARETSDAPAN